MCFLLCSYSLQLIRLLRWSLAAHDANRNFTGGGALRGSHWRPRNESGSSSRPLPASLATPAVDLRDRSAHSLNRPPWIKRQTLADAAANDKARTVINPMSQSLP
jgi:hypothetical protein